MERSTIRRCAQALQAGNKTVGDEGRVGYTCPMSDNVIKFERPKKPVPPRQTPPWLKRLLVILAIALGLAAVWTYFYISGGQLSVN